MGTPMTLQALEALNPASSRWLTTAMVGVLGVGMNVPGRRVRFDVQGWEHLPESSTVIVANHTHWLDWIGLRWVGWWRGRRLCNWVKPRTYEEGYAGFLDRSGNVPVASRGYLLAADFRALHGRRPDEAEYRALRDHLDAGTPLPDAPAYDAVQGSPRVILGLNFDPNAETWRQCTERLFHTMMATTLRHTHALCDAGVDLQIMPQGVTSQRLTRGHPGALQAALALGLPVVPVGINGFPAGWGPGETMPVGGEIRIRVGPAYRPDPIEGHTPFLPESERTHADALQRGTTAMMARVAALLEPQHAADDDGAEQLDVTGVARFV